MKIDYYLVPEVLTFGLACLSVGAIGALLWSRFVLKLVESKAIENMIYYRDLLDKARQENTIISVCDYGCNSFLPSSVKEFTLSG